MRPKIALWTSRVLGFAFALSLPLAGGWVMLQWMFLSTRLAITSDASIDWLRFVIAIVTPAVVLVTALLFAWLRMKSVSDELNPKDWR